MLNRDLGRDINNNDTVKIVITERKSLMSPGASRSLSKANIIINNSAPDSSTVTPIIINIKKNVSQETQSIDLAAYQNNTIKELKLILAADEINSNRQVRCIYEGKPLQDEDIVSNIKFKNETFLHVFISVPIEKNVALTTVGAELFDPERRGLDKLRLLDIMEEEIILFRGKFHKNYILFTPKDYITENELIKKEDEFMEMNNEKFKYVDQIREIFKEYELKVIDERGTLSNLLNGLLCGLIFGIFSIFLMCSKEKSIHFRIGVYLGLFIFFAGLIYYIYV